MKKKLNDDMLEQISDKFRALSEPMRLKIIHQLMSGEKTVTELVEIMQCSQANVSKHLAVLKNSSMIAVKKSGTSRLCSIADPTVFQLCKLMCQRLQDEHAMQKKILTGKGV